MTARCSLCLFVILLALAKPGIPSETAFDEYEAKYETLIKLYRLGNAALIYAPYPISRDAGEEIAAAQLELSEFLRKMTPATLGETYSAQHLESLAVRWRIAAAVDYYRLYLLAQANANPSEAQYFLDKALGLAGGPEFESDLESRASRIRHKQATDLFSLCEEERKRFDSICRNPEPLRVYRSSPVFDHTLFELGPTVPDFEKFPDPTPENQATRAD